MPTVGPLDGRLRLCGALLVVSAAVAAAAPASAADLTVSYLSGKAQVTNKASKRWRALRRGAKLTTGDTLRTLAKARVELLFADGSKVRIGPRSRLTIDQTKFTGKTRDAVGLKLTLGRLWANVAKAARGTATFEVRTRNAISGVRGTSFAVFAAADASAIFRVYAGSVGVRAALGEGTNRKRVPGPQQIDRGQWEEIVATALRQVKVSKLGDVAPAEDFEADPAADAWASWNKKRDRR